MITWLILHFKKFLNYNTSGNRCKKIKSFNHGIKGTVCVITSDLLSSALNLLFQNFKIICKKVETQDKIAKKNVENDEKNISDL